MTQHTHAPASVPPPLLNVDAVDEKLKAIYQGFKEANNTEFMGKFRETSLNYGGWRLDEVKANTFLRDVERLVKQATPAIEEADPWNDDFALPAVPQPAPVSPGAVVATAPIVPTKPISASVPESTEEAEPVQATPPADEEQPEQSDGDTAPPETEASDVDSEEPTELEEEPNATEGIQEALPPVAPPSPPAAADSLFGQLRSLFHRGPGSAYRITGSFLPDGRQSLVFIDDHGNAARLNSFPIVGTDAELDTELAPALLQYLSQPAQNVRSIAEQAAQAGASQVQANKKAAPKASTAKAAPAAKTPAAAKPATPKAPATTGGVRVTVTPAVDASVSYDGPHKNKFKLTGGTGSTPSDLPVGDYTMRVTANGYLELDEKFSIKAGEVTEVALALTSSGLDF